MSLSERNKVGLWILLSTCVYFGGLLGMVLFVLGSWSKTSSLELEGPLVIFIVYLVFFPFLQSAVSRRLKKAGHITAAEGISKSILVEFALLLLILAINSFR